VLAAIGKVETNHGRLQAPGVTSGANFAGAAGPMQIGIGGKAGNTFGAYAVDGDGDGISNVDNPADAIFTAASYLCRNGGGNGGDLSRAVFAYNHADWYVTKVLAIASTYEAATAAPWGWRPSSAAQPRCCGDHHPIRLRPARQAVRLGCRGRQLLRLLRADATRL
jgi:Transglycosylase SLT domain